MAYSHIIGFDDAPFERSSHGPVRVVGAVYAGERLDGIVSGQVMRDGDDATDVLARLVTGSKFAEHLQLVMLQGLTLAGFNVVDVPRLHRLLDLPVLVVARNAPDLDAIRDALLTYVPGGAEKWGLIASLDPMEPLAGVFVQRAGLTRAEARQILDRTARHSLIPEPLRTAHLVAGGVTTGESGRRG